KGELLVIAGGVGSGKSTLLNVLMGILPKDSGEVLWNGRDVERYNEFFRAPNVAYTSQISKMFTQDIRENLLMGKPFDKEAVKEALCDAGIIDTTEYEKD
ncbi:MAG: ATP-binding cassette domain-containing protein, partial [Muribaculaceae bacterium]